MGMRMGRRCVVWMLLLLMVMLLFGEDFRGVSSCTRMGIAATAHAAQVQTRTHGLSWRRPTWS